MNQKHVNILKAELRESRKKIHELENRLKMDSSSKAELAKRVQSVLKSQWMEALNVISGNDDLSKVLVTLLRFQINGSVYCTHDLLRGNYYFLIFKRPFAVLTFEFTAGGILFFTLFIYYSLRS